MTLAWATTQHHAGAAHVPRLTVGLPVYDGERYLAGAIESYLAQTFTDFELIISDNCSTERTPEICRHYAARDARIRYLRQPRNIGGSINHNFLVGVARGEFFKWASDDDVVEPTLLERCVAALDADHGIVLAHSHMGYIDAHGDAIGLYDYTAATDSDSAAERFASLLYTDGGDDGYGVIRLEVLKQTPLWNSYHQSGRPLVAELALHGRFYQVPETLFYRRDHPERDDRTSTIKGLSTKQDPRRRNHSTARLVAEYLLAYIGAIRRAPLSSRERFRCYLAYARWLATHGLPPRHRRVDLTKADP